MSVMMILIGKFIGKKMEIVWCDILCGFEKCESWLILFVKLLKDFLVGFMKIWKLNGWLRGLSLSGMILIINF